MKVRILALMACAGLCAASLAYADPTSDVPGDDNDNSMQMFAQNSSMSGAMQSDTSSMSGPMDNNSSQTPADTSNGNDDMSADTATGDDDY